MKKYLLLTGAGILMISFLGYMSGNIPYSRNLVSQKSEIQEPQKFIYNTDALIKKAQESINGKYIQNIDKKGLAELYKDIQSDSIPRIFVEKIPEDFKVESVADKTLFMKLMSPHLLRVNEKIMRERKVILILDEKIKEGIALSSKEEAFFSKMAEKYDVVHLNSKISQITELVKRVDVIPVSLGMAISVWSTNWGQKEKESPFFEHGWNEKVEYKPIQFQKLSEATESFALQMNSRSQLTELRSIRAHFRLFKNNQRFGKDLVYGIRNYAHFIPSFMEQILLVYDLGYIKEMDEACFSNGCELTK